MTIFLRVYAVLWCAHFGWSLTRTERHRRVLQSLLNAVFSEDIDERVSCLSVSIIKRSISMGIVERPGRVVSKDKKK